MLPTVRSGHLSPSPFSAPRWRTACGARPHRMPNYWLMKSEPDEVSIDDLARAPSQTLPWTGVRNYQARNYLRDHMRPGDGVLFYHSSCPQPGVAGIAQVAGLPEPDTTQFDPTSPYFDAKANAAAPRWVQVDVALVRKTGLLSLAHLRAAPELASLRILQKGNRLSVTPVSPGEWQAVLARLPKAAS
jgi:predicted RNA-binding protein with PUA-like domain